MAIVGDRWNGNSKVAMPHASHVTRCSTRHGKLLGNMRELCILVRLDSTPITVH